MSSGTTGATTPSNNSSSLSLLGLDPRLIPIVSALIAFAIFVLLFLAVTATVLHFRQANGYLESPTSVARRRGIYGDEEEIYKDRPLMRSVDIEIDLEVGDHSRWQDIMVCAEFFIRIPN